jgi:hypothetical protein
VHFVIVADYSGATVKFYRNGILVSTRSMTGTLIFPSDNVAKTMGSANSNLYEDELRMYNRELSAAEVKALYEGTK